MTGTRVVDDYCAKTYADHDSYAFWWISSHSTYVVPAVGSRLSKSHFVTKVPSGAAYRPGGLPKSGGSVKSYVQNSKPSFTKPNTSSGGGYKAPSAPKAPAPKPPSIRR